MNNWYQGPNNSTEENDMAHAFAQETEVTERRLKNNKVDEKIIIKIIEIIFADHDEEYINPLLERQKYRVRRYQAASTILGYQDSFELFEALRQYVPETYERFVSAFDAVGGSFYGPRDKGEFLRNRDNVHILAWLRQNEKGNRAIKTMGGGKRSGGKRRGGKRITRKAERRSKKKTIRRRK
jgi:hypothetical protein